MFLTANRRRARRELVLISLSLVLLAGAAGAQSARSGGDATARLQAAIQQLTNERAELQAENAKLADRVKELEKDLGTAERQSKDLGGQLRQAEGRASQADANSEVLRRNYELTRQRLDEVVGKYRELAEQLQGVETERTQLAADLANRSKSLESCQAGNLELAGIANDALDRYEQKGCFGSLAQAEPFTGLKRAEVERIVEDYRNQVYDLALDKQAVRPAE